MVRRFRKGAAHFSFMLWNLIPWGVFEPLLWLFAVVYFAKFLIWFFQSITRL